MKKIKLISGDITPGRPLPWSIYDDKHRMLLDRGNVIDEESRVEDLLKRGIYRLDIIKKNINLEKFQITRTSNPFDVLDEFSSKLKCVFKGLKQGNNNVHNTLSALANGIQQICDIYPDATLGAVQLRHNQEYSVCHSIYIAVLCELVAKRMEIPENERLSIISAALVCNIGMQEVQKQLYHQNEKPSEEQKTVILEHCENSALILEKANFEDGMALNIIRQHHEKTDGTGYPKGLSGRDILVGARIIALSDYYSAMISPRRSRIGISANNALRDIFINKNNDYDEGITRFFIKELGIYPPGSFVRLVNGDIAIVLRRSNETTGTGIMVQIFDKIDDKNHLSLNKRDCSYDEYTIKEPYIPIKSLTFNVAMLWARM